MKYKELTKEDFKNKEKVYTRGRLTVGYVYCKRDDTFFYVELDKRYILFSTANGSFEVGLKALNNKLESLFNALGE